MHGLIREEYTFPASAKVLARHIYSRMYCGKIVIVTENPNGALSSLRKQWLKLIYKAQIERARTLSAARIKELTSMVAKMQTMRFKVGWSIDDYNADVYLATVEDLLSCSPECGTIYFTCSTKLDQRHLICAWMRKGSLVVSYS